MQVKQLRQMQHPGQARGDTSAAVAIRFNLATDAGQTASTDGSMQSAAVSGRRVESTRYLPDGSYLTVAPRGLPDAATTGAASSSASTSVDIEDIGFSFPGPPAVKRKPYADVPYSNRSDGLYPRRSKMMEAQANRDMQTLTTPPPPPPAPEPEPIPRQPEPIPSLTPAPRRTPPFPEPTLRPTLRARLEADDAKYNKLDDLEQDEEADRLQRNALQGMPLQSKAAPAKAPVAAAPSPPHQPVLAPSESPRAAADSVLSAEAKAAGFVQLPGGPSLGWPNHPRGGQTHTAPSPPVKAAPRKPDQDLTMVQLQQQIIDLQQKVEDLENLSAAPSAQESGAASSSTQPAAAAPSASESGAAEALSALQKALEDVDRSDIADVSPEGHSVLHTAFEKLRQNHLDQPETTIATLVRAIPDHLINLQTTQAIPRGLPLHLSALAQAASGQDQFKLRAYAMTTLLKRRADVHLRDAHGSIVVVNK